MVEVARRTSTTIPTVAGGCSDGVKETWTRMARIRLVPMSAFQHQTCYRHPNRETGLSCSDCGRPICTECMTVAPVGLRCPEHAGGKQRQASVAVGGRRDVMRAPQTPLQGGQARVTQALVAINAPL